MLHAQADGSWMGDRNTIIQEELEGSLKAERDHMRPMCKGRATKAPATANERSE